MDRKTRQPNVRPRTASSSKRIGDEIPKRMKVEIRGDAVMSFEMGGPIPQTTTTTAMTKSGRARPSRAGTSDLLPLETDPIRNTDGARGPAPVNATQPQTRRHRRELRRVDERSAHVLYQWGSQGEPCQESPSLQEFVGRPSPRLRLGSAA